jgi:PadR family transcriptional regulator PadR
MGAAKVPIGGDLLRGNVITLILSLLREEPMYGLQIAKEIERRSEETFRFQEGLLYPTLHQLENDGLVEGEWRASRQGPGRKYYALTRKGRKEAERLRQRWSVFTRAVSQVLEGRSGG